MRKMVGSSLMSFGRFLEWAGRQPNAPRILFDVQLMQEILAGAYGARGPNDAEWEAAFRAAGVAAQRVLVSCSQDCIDRNGRYVDDAVRQLSKGTLTPIGAWNLSQDLRENVDLVELIDKVTDDVFGENRFAVPVSEAFSDFLCRVLLLLDRSDRKAGERDDMEIAVDFCRALSDFVSTTELGDGRKRQRVILRGRGLVKTIQGFGLCADQIPLSVLDLVDPLCTEGYQLRVATVVRSVATKILPDNKRRRMRPVQRIIAHPDLVKCPAAMD